jgi:hypothetical protein
LNEGENLAAEGENDNDEFEFAERWFSSDDEDEGAEDEW